MKRILLTLVAVFTFTFVFGQSEKFSASTLQFISERDGEINLPKIGEKIDIKSTTANFGSPIDLTKDPQFKGIKTRKIAEVEMVNGVKMISAFIGVNNNDFSGLEGLGVVYQSKFNNLTAALIPIDKIEDVAALNNVTYIEVAEVLNVANDRQRAVTQAGDAISNSAAAQALGLTKQYTGKNVILGIIDTGVDFTHIAFKDKNGNSRIKRAYKLQSANSSSLTTYSSASQIAGLTYDTDAEDHGTHTSTTAGGSSVIVNGTNVSVTDNHANATYGGMAPEADLVIAGLSSLYTTAIGTAIQNICNYADQQGKPCVISLSLGSQQGPHDGTGSIATIVQQYAGNNHIIVYAASNDGMRADAFVKLGTSNGGGMYASGTSTSAKPMLVNVQRSFQDADGNVEMLYPTISAFPRSTGATALKFHVVNVNTGAIVWSSSQYTNSTTISVTGTTGLAQYFKCPSTQYTNMYGDAGSIRITRTATNNKYSWQIYAPIMVSTSYNDNDGDEIYTSDYAFCVSIYPTTANTSMTIDMWENQYSWFSTDLNLNSSTSNSYNYCKGNDECSVSDNACFPNVISVGAYVTKNSITDYSGTTYDFSGEYPNIGDHASFSSWQTAGYGPLGTALPHISAPGARIVAGVNHYHTASVDDYSYYGDDYKTDLVVNSSTSPYAAMEGTSMATPCVSGIIAQWLEACVEKGITPNPNYIKEVMEATWDTDQWTNGTGTGAHGANTFGTHGKINAIKGLQYILGVTGGPTISATTDELDFECNENKTQTLTVNVTGTQLEGNITATITDDDDHVFSINPASIAKQSDGTASGTISVTFSPTTAGEYLGELTLSSQNADPVSILLYGKANAPSLFVDPTALTFNIGAGASTTQQFSILGENLNGVVNLTLSGDSEFTLSSNTATKAEAESGKNFTVTFAPATDGSYTGTITLTTEGATSQTITLNGTATKGWQDITVTTYGVATLYSDLDLKIPYEESDGDILGVYYASEYDLDEGELKLRRLTGNYIPALTAVIVMANSGNYRFYKSTTAVQPFNKTNVLKGVLEETSVSSLGGRILTLGMGTNGYIGFYTYTGSKIRANSVYLDLSDNNTKSLNALSISLGGVENTTTIQNIFGPVAQEDKDNWYTLQGIKLNGKPSLKGLYINNGKTVIIK